MKKSVIFILALTAVCVSCSRDEALLFDQSAAERAHAAMVKAEDVLVGSENGWHMVYFANPEKKTSAHVGLSFKTNGQVEATMGYGKSAKSDKESLWEVVNDICPLLTFNTYNNIMHIWADPQTDGLGYEGDYEFLILESSPERVRLKGKKYGAYTVLYPLKKGEDIATITEQAAAIETKIFSNGNLLEYRDGSQAYTIFNDEGILRFASLGQIFAVEDPYTPSAAMPDGLHLMTTMTGSNNTNRYFKFGEDGLLHAESANITPSSQYVLNYMKLMGRGWTWDMNAAVPAGLDSIVKQVNEELCDMAGQKGKKRTSKILSLRLTYGEDYIFGEQVITYLMELKYTDKTAEYGHIYYEFKVNFSGDAFSINYLKPLDTRDKQAEQMLAAVPTLKTLFQTISGTYNYTSDLAINPSLGGVMVNADASKNINIKAKGTDK